MFGAAILSSGLVLVAGCNSNLTPLKAYVIVVPPSSTMVDAGSSTFIMASSVPTGITWSLSGIGCSGAACGSLTNVTDTSVNYVAPATIPGSSMNVTITAASATANSVVNSITLTVLPIIVTIATPASDILAPGASVQLTASVSNDLSDEGVSWSLNGGSGCTGSACGALSKATASSVIYTAPKGASAVDVLVVATSVADTAVSASQALTVPVLSSAITFSPNNLPPAIAGEPYKETVVVAGGTAHYMFLVSGQPSWLNITMTNDTVTFAGTPPAGTIGINTIQIVANDSSQPAALTNIAQMTLTTEGTGVDDSLLKGSYTFFGTGWMDGTTIANTQPIAYIGSFTTDGSGTITQGEMDINGPGGLESYSSITGTYNIDANHAGLLILLPNGATAPITLAVSLSGINNNVATSGFFTEYDDTTGIGTGLSNGSSGLRISGPIALQSDSVLNSSTSPLTGSYAFGMRGRNPVVDITSTCDSTTCGPVSLAGALTMGSNGVIASGEEDVTQGKTTASLVPLSGTLNNAGNTDAFGRVTGAINASSTSLIAWPSNFILYMVNPQTFYVMSANSYITSTLVTGQAMQQNLADIASTPFSSANPLVLFGNPLSTNDFPTPDGQTRVELQLLTPVPTSATAGSLSGFQFVNASGTYTNNAAVAKFTYTVSADGRVATSTVAEPYMYLVDTNTGFATNYGAPAGVFQFFPQTNTALNAGTYAWSTPISNSEVTATEVGTLTIPDGGLPTTASNVAVTGEAYASYESLTTEQTEAVLSATPASVLVDGLFTGTMSNTNGLLPTGDFTVTGGAMVCNSGGGYVISQTQFACVLPNVGGFDAVIFFQQ
jgi:hypothetical protein